MFTIFKKITTIALKKVKFCLVLPLVETKSCNFPNKNVPVLNSHPVLHHSHIQQQPEKYLNCHSIYQINNALETLYEFYLFTYLPN